MVTGPQYTVVMARDVETSTRFYEKHMGWERSGVQPMGGEMFNTKPAIFIILPLAVASAGYDGPVTGFGMQLALHCDDVQDRFQSMTAAGVEVVFPMTDTGFQTLFAVKDPDGYIIVLAQDN